jgi:hypothetical protein
MEYYPSELGTRIEGDYEVKKTHAIPLIFDILPDSVKFTPALMTLTDGHLKQHSPPPSGGWPRFEIFNSSFAAFSPSQIPRVGKPLTLRTSTDRLSLVVVIPFKINVRSCLQNGAMARIGVRKYPMEDESGV